MPCWYCGIRLKKGGHQMRTRDHVIPKSKGGVRTVDACLKCNGAKSDMSLEEFRVLRGGIEFWGEMKARLANSETAWLVTQPVYFTPEEKRKIVPQMDERPVYTPVVDLSSRKFTLGEKIKKTKAARNKGICMPSSPPDLLGKEFGAFTVVSRITGKWEVECVCGAIEYRSSKAVTNPANTFDACVECRRPVGRLKSFIFHKTGVDVSWEDCFHFIYDKKYMKNSQEQEYTPANGEASNQVMNRRPKNNTDEKLLQTEREILHVEEAILRREDEILHVEEENHRVLEEIERRLRQRSHSSALQFLSGDTTMPNNDLTLNVGQTSTASPITFLADGVTPSGATYSAATYTFSDPSATVVLNPDGVTAIVTGVAASTGPVSGSVSFTATDSDGAVSTWTNAFTITTNVVTPPPPDQLSQSSALQFSDPA